ncbi:interleukin-17C-like [Pempheris klunzingeri]|uniref:interleukin-17C-like n=1 Tax=Pempheris klunzingeri TaxID=3127111 RepID=UPI0039806E3F
MEQPVTVRELRDQDISLCSLLIISNHVSSSPPFIPAARGSRCISKAQFHRLDRRYQARLRATGGQQGTRTCAQAAGEMRGEAQHRSLAPWTYRIDVDDDRLPSKIAFAECLCSGCIINRHESMSYNSVLVFGPLLVRRKTECLDEPGKYAAKKELIQVPVGCTCVVPKQTK